MMMKYLATSALLVALAQALTLPFSPVPMDVLDAEGFEAQPEPLLAASPNGGAPDRTGWGYTSDSNQAGSPPSNAQDGNSNTYWHSMYSPTLHNLPHTFYIDTKQNRWINGITYRPRQDGSKNGNIGQHKVYVSTDNTNWGNPVAYGTWFDDATEKTAAFEPVNARYVMIKCITEAGNRGQWSSAAEFYVYTLGSYTKPSASLGLWGPTVDFPLVPCAAGVMPDTGRVLTWSSYTSATFSNGPGGETLTSTYDPATKIVSQRLVTNTQHDMFCPGIAFTATGTVIITGGNNAPKTSIYTDGSQNWSPGTDMYIPRGYQSLATMANGDLFTIGGSWSGGQGGKNAERYQPSRNTWYKLPNGDVSKMLTGDAQGIFRADNHAWLFAWKNNNVLQAGPSKQMNWYSGTGNGGTVSAGNRGNDIDSMCGNAVMYDANLGKIVTFGGSTSYQGAAAHANAHTMSLGNENTIVNVNNINPMWFSRIFHSSVIAPDGLVYIFGGQTTGVPFSDAGSIYTPEQWNPATTNFYKMAPNNTPRNYHSWTLLMMDGSIFNGGGGLCGTCSTNHMDGQLYYPPYLVNADGSFKTRPVINSISSRSNKPGATITVNTNSAVTKFAMIRYSTATHTVNTDQRYIPLTPQNAGTNTYKITLGPANGGQVTPGYWQLYALNAAGTPSTATTLLIQIM